VGRHPVLRSTVRDLDRFRPRSPARSAFPRAGARAFAQCKRAVCSIAARVRDGAVCSVAARVRDNEMEQGHNGEEKRRGLLKGTRRSADAPSWPEGPDGRCGHQEVSRVERFGSSPSAPRSGSPRSASQLVSPRSCEMDPVIVLVSH
jgi:hypothetical protein